MGAIADTSDCSNVMEVTETETPLPPSTDNCSVASLELSSPPDSKRSKRSKPSNLSRMTSLASVISTPVAKMGHALQRCQQQITAKLNSV